MPEYLGELPHPRILIHGFEEESTLVSHVQKIAPTVRLIQSNELFQIRQQEWDALITRGAITGQRDSLCVFQVGGSPVGSTHGENGDQISVLAKFKSNATHFILPTALNSDIRSLVRDKLVPHIQERPINTIWSFQHGTGTPLLAPSSWANIEPFLTDADGCVLAGRLKRGKKETWWIPDIGCNLVQWLSAAMEAWSLRDPSAFPIREEWKERDAWKMPAEKILDGQLKKVHEKIANTVKQLTKEAEELSAAIAEKSAEVDAQERLLLTAQGDELVDCVELTLSEFGFTVINVDKTISTPGDRREDLRVTDPDDSDWTAIAEVRGYSRGAQLNDLLRLSRFATRFVKETGTEPSSVWYMVNQEIKKDPDTRQTPLASNRDEVETFAESGGAVIDTRDLFRILTWFQAGEIDSATARQMLKTTTGRFTPENPRAASS
ncbi:hypothetical protein ACFXG9_00860 [Streptomyces mirabilis]|uniref:hypothetical protein n=1 Tax=Streptomyces mirabilis TaxID=68239 RepID=UPI00367E3BE4